MKIAELLLETGDRPYPLDSWTYAGPGTDEMTVKLPDGRKMDMYFEYAKNWAVFTFLIDEAQYKTGGGDAIRIFSTARQAVIDWVRKKRPQYLAFTGNADESSRTLLYDRMIERLPKMPEFSNWVNITNRPDLWPQGFDTYMDQRNPGIDLKTYIIASPNVMK